ncbi:hypothetical protein BCR35DRAFT_304929 [Leucosporidium creatinivorum]|uniref:Zn(2)-C6 fungal-type domain-containing protein n=1 Tax=Leucosporidium creatinivorum TaxID=106004 RepID=A0A1Y2F4R8_9BASI|nr:hypothetical protein BCR35DRAFT_304929 [Leucosporidium creatinivorum]
MSSSSSSSTPPAVKKAGRLTCDSCRIRKVKCIPPSDGAGGPCTQCSRHSVPCTHTPHVRKKMLPRNGKRIEQCRAAASESTRINNADDSGSPELTMTRVDGALACAQVSTILASHLLQQFRQTPETYLSLLDLSGLIREVESVSGRVDLLPPTHEALARVIMAQTACYSSHPLLFGPPLTPNSSSGIPSFDLVAGPSPPPFTDLREYGRRRASLCHELREAAVRCVWEKGTMAKVDDDENAATCWIVSRLVEGQPEGAGTPYLVAAVTQFRILASKGHSSPRDSKWPFYFLLESLYSLQAGMPSTFTDSDFLLLCGPIPRPLGDYAHQARHMECIDVFDAFVCPYLYHAAALARTCVINFTGAYARQQPISAASMQEYLTSLESLHDLLTILDARADGLLGAMPPHIAATCRLAACRQLVNFGWCALALAPIQELKRRIAELDALGESGRTPMERGLQKEALAVMLAQASRIGDRATAIFVERASRISTLAWLSAHLVHLDYAGWWEQVKTSPAREEDRRSRAGGLLHAALLSGWTSITSAPVDAAIQEMNLYLSTPSSHYGLPLPPQQQIIPTDYNNILPFPSPGPQQPFFDSNSHAAHAAYWSSSGTPATGSASGSGSAHSSPATEDAPPQWAPLSSGMTAAAGWTYPDQTGFVEVGLEAPYYA